MIEKSRQQVHIIHASVSVDVNLSKHKAVSPNKHRIAKPQSTSSSNIHGPGMNNLSESCLKSLKLQLLINGLHAGELFVTKSSKDSEYLGHRQFYSPESIFQLQLSNWPQMYKKQQKSTQNDLK